MYIWLNYSYYEACFQMLILFCQIPFLNSLKRLFVKKWLVCRKLLHPLYFLAAWHYLIRFATVHYLQNPQRSCLNSLSSSSSSRSNSSRNKNDSTAVHYGALPTKSTKVLFKLFKQQQQQQKQQQQPKITATKEATQANSLTVSCQFKNT